MKQLHWTLFAVLSLALVTACAPPPTVKPGDSQLPEATDAQSLEALQLYQSGEYLLAAPLLEQIAAGKSPPASWQWLLQAADAYLQYGDKAKAAELLGQLPEQLPDVNLSLLARILQAELLLQEYRPDEALMLLHREPQADVAEYLRQRYYRMIAEAYRLSGNLLESANALQQLDAMLPAEPEARLENQLAIIRTLATLTDNALSLLQPSPPGIQGGWMELARLIKLYGQTPDNLQPRLQQWRQQFPQHPAMQELLDGYFQKLEAQYQQASHIAVLLPESGRYRNAANAIRQGLLAAWYNHPQASRPVLRFYDSTNPEQAWPLYIEATERGADFVIGPLQKQAVNQLIHAGELPVPVLALNQVASNVSPPQNFYQYALSPEDEARQVAERAWIDGYRMPVTLTPDSPWGARVLAAFEQRWQQLGGLLTESQTYNPRDNDFGQPIQALLDIDQSKQRRNQIQRLIGEGVEFEPRRRADTDFIFVAAQPVNARQIRPQLQFHHALNLPIYTTSHAWQGFVEKDKDRDIEGILFPDIPWLLADEGDQPLSFSRLNQRLQLTRSSSLRLTAMGIDSYQLLGHLARLQTSENEALDGKTGQLYMDRLNILHRQLVWARMKNSTPRVIGYAPRLIDNTLNEEVEIEPAAPVIDLSSDASAATLDAARP
ncbi:MAG: penicillin-binding protein activator [Chromatiales bacterium]|jgi:hypothetical protein